MFFYFLAAVVGYLLGSIPFGLVIVRLAGVGDIRKIGSGNIGATNVLRTGRKDLALATVICDVCKAGVAAVLMMALANDGKELTGLIAGTFGVLGHNFPIWLQFRGGKGVASTIGMMLFLSFSTGFMVALTWLGVAIASRYSSLSALIAIGLSPLYVYIATNNVTYVCFYAFLAILCWIRHKDNIKRLISGSESKITFKKSA